MKILCPEFIDVPSDGASFLTVYTTGSACVPLLIDLAVIDHIKK
jgi:hypothetical protein